MRKRISLLIAALMLALTMSFGSMAAFAVPYDQTTSDRAANIAKYNDCEHDHPQGNYCENKFL